MLLRDRRRNRSGNVLVLAASLMIVMFAMLAFVVDIGYLQVVRSQMQSSADATALAAAWDLIDEDILAGTGDPYQAIALARATADQYAGLNLVAGQPSALTVADVQIGQINNPYDPNEQMSFVDPSRFNVVQVLIRRTAQQNGEIPTFFSRALGINSWGGQAQATAMFLNNLSGFQTPTSGENIQLLPFALDKPTWDALIARQVTDDDWMMDPNTNLPVSGSDGILEVNLYPQGTGSPGNRGTVDIGSSSNSTADIVQQILYGISPADLAYHGGSLQFDQNGELFLNADTGISAGFKDELEAIRGQPRIIPIFSDLNGNGNNAMYTIVQFAGIRIMEVKLTGKMSGKRVIIQPASINSNGLIPPTGTDQKSDFVYSPVWLVQ